MAFPAYECEITTVELFEISANRSSVYVIGEMIYRDDLDNVRTTGFCRKWCVGYHRFLPEDNPDYENAD